MNFSHFSPNIYDVPYSTPYTVAYDSNISIEEESYIEQDEIGLVDIEDDEVEEEIIPFIEFPTNEMFEA